MDQSIEWNENINSAEWDKILSLLQGHPLQSCMWGHARKLIDGINAHYWAIYQNDQPLSLIRFEERRFLKFIKIAWVPQALTQLDNESLIKKEFLKRLKKKGFFLCAVSPWKEFGTGRTHTQHHYTIWIDLTLGKEKLWSNLHKQFRYDAKNAKKKGIIIEKSTADTDINRFFKLCEATSINKGFRLNTSVGLMTQLLNNENNVNVEGHFFVARFEGNLCGGAFIIRCGKSIHYMWGAIDRTYSKLSIGEALQWDVIEWAIDQGCTLYDLEGINPKITCGTFLFKKKMGGKVVTLPGVQLHPIGLLSKMAVALIKLKHKRKVNLIN